MYALSLYTHANSVYGVVACSDKSRLRFSQAASPITNSLTHWLTLEPLQTDAIIWSQKVQSQRTLLPVLEPVLEGDNCSERIAKLESFKTPSSRLTPYNPVHDIWRRLRSESDTIQSKKASVAVELLAWKMLKDVINTNVRSKGSRKSGSHHEILCLEGTGLKTTLLTWGVWVVAILVQCISAVVASQYGGSHTNQIRFPLPSSICIWFSVCHPRNYSCSSFW